MLRGWDWKNPPQHCSSSKAVSPTEPCDSSWQAEGTGYINLTHGQHSSEHGQERRRLCVAVCNTETTARRQAAGQVLHGPAGVLPLYWHTRWTTARHRLHVMYCFGQAQPAPERGAARADAENHP